MYSFCDDAPSLHIMRPAYNLCTIAYCLAVLTGLLAHCVTRAFVSGMDMCVVTCYILFIPLAYMFFMVALLLIYVPKTERHYAFRAPVGRYAFVSAFVTTSVSIFMCMPVIINGGRSSLYWMSCIYRMLIQSSVYPFSLLFGSVVVQYACGLLTMYLLNALAAYGAYKLATCFYTCLMGITKRFWARFTAASMFAAGILCSTFTGILAYLFKSNFS